MSEESVSKATEPATSVDWGHAVFLALVGGAILWYLLDAISVSTDINNLLVVAPISGVALILCLVIIPQLLRRHGQAVQGKGTSGIKEMGAAELRSTELKHLASIGGVAASLGIYVFMLNVIGFDIATWLFCTAVMFVCGERRPLALATFPLIAAVVLILAFKALLPYPMYTMVL
ncbi:MAG TPA: tripartite tricarboxylate transporter TctB family protein [Stellaceae bacterium]|jgi:hypothetical protein|nr:tripartite tricarboxylate transporter TctB family protein [Stellaceae bacterium]